MDNEIIKKIVLSIPVQVTFIVWGAWLVLSIWFLFIAAILEATGDIVGAEVVAKLSIYYWLDHSVWN